MFNFGMSFPAISGGVVTQGHADYCAAHGHATHTVHKQDGTVHFVSPNCPRCGVSIRAEFDMQKAWQFIVDSYDGNRANYSPTRREWTEDEILAFVAEHHVDGIDAVRTGKA